MSGLGLREWDFNDFLEIIACKADEDRDEPDEDFMGWLISKSTEWLQELYYKLADEKEIEDEIYQLSGARIVRLSDGSFCSPEKCYFPDEQQRLTNIVPCVDSAIFEVGNSKARKEGARKFLEEIGVREIGERELVEVLLEREYKSTEHPLKEEAHLNHLLRFMKLANDDAFSLNILRDYKLFLGADGHWNSASQIYLDRPYVETGMSDYYGIAGLPKGTTALAELYKDLPIDTTKLFRFVESLGAKLHMPVLEVSCRQNPDWDLLRRVPGDRYTSSAADEDYRLEDFKNLVAARNVRISRLIWNTICERGKDNTWRSILKARFQKSSSRGTHSAPSQLVHPGGLFARSSVAANNARSSPRTPTALCALSGRSILSCPAKSPSMNPSISSWRILPSQARYS